MPSSFLPKPFAHNYEIDPQYAKSAVYFSCEFAIDQSFKIYSGGLGFLAGSHMRSAAALRQNLCGIGILWTYGYYNQARTHLALCKDAPVSRSIERLGRIIAEPVVGGLHHRYARI